MGYAERGNLSRVVAEVKPPPATVLTSNQPILAADVLDRVQQLAALRHYDQAVELLNSAGRDRRLLNAKGVCLLRAGRFKEAVRLYRDLVINPGCTWMRSDLPIVYKTNYATALLLGGQPCGCLAILAELKDEQNPTVRNLRAAIRAWASGFSFWQKLNWWTGRIEPANRPVTITFDPGEFESFPAREQAPPVGPGRAPQAA